MDELKTYLTPAAQLFFFVILAIVWLTGFIRQRNIGFLLLAFVVLVEGALNLLRQTIVNYVIFHQSALSATERTNTIWLISMVFLMIYIFFWVLAIIGALLIVFQRPKPRPAQEGLPPVPR